MSDAGAFSYLKTRRSAPEPITLLQAVFTGCRRELWRAGSRRYNSRPGITSFSSHCFSSQDRTICTTPSPDEVTQLLVDWSNGSDAAFERLTPLVYEELHRLAHRHMRHERRDHTLQTSALVNEAYVRLIDQHSVDWQSRTQFFSIASRLMRRILVDHARAHNRVKRGGGALQVSLDEAASVSGERAAELIALDDALSDLAAIDQRKTQVVELRFFGGMSVEEIAAVLKVSAVTVMRDWSTAKAWLKRALETEVTSPVTTKAKV